MRLAEGIMLEQQVLSNHLGDEAVLLAWPRSPLCLMLAVKVNLFPSCRYR